METFVARYRSAITATLSGFDRLVFRGTLLPLVIERGYGSMVEDVDGNVFLDCAAGIAVNSTGHAHPAVVGAIVGLYVTGNTVNMMSMIGMIMLMGIMSRRSSRSMCFRQTIK